MDEVCNDNRFEIIKAAKQRLIEATNIESRPEEMAVLDSILFRMWQMHWLPTECRNTSLKSDQFICSNCLAHYDIARLDIDVDDDTGIPDFCPNCGAKVVVVRCKDCKYWKVNSNQLVEHGIDCHTNPDGFCAWGERR